MAYLSWTDTDMVRGADENPALREMRADMPLLAHRTIPLTPAADALVRGIARRAPHVYGQRWLPPVQLVRGLLPWLTRFASRDMPEIESRWLATGAEPTLSARAAPPTPRCGPRPPPGTSSADARSQRS